MIDTTCDTEGLITDFDDKPSKSLKYLVFYGVCWCVRNDIIRTGTTEY